MAYLNLSSQQVSQRGRGSRSRRSPRTTTPRARCVRIVVVQRETIDDLRDIRPPSGSPAPCRSGSRLLDQGADKLEVMSVRLRGRHTAEALEYGAKATTLLDRARELVAPLPRDLVPRPRLPTV